MGLPVDSVDGEIPADSMYLTPSEHTVTQHTYVHKVRHPRCVCNKLDCSVYTCLTELYGGRDMYRIYYIKIPSYNSFTSNTDQTNYGNQTRGIIIVKHNNKVMKSAIHYNYKNHSCVKRKTNLMPLILLFNTHSLLNMFRPLIRPSSGVCD